MFSEEKFKHKYYNEEIVEPLLPIQRYILWSVFIIGIILMGVLMIGMGSAGDCPTGWTFIDKPSYNVCYLPNVTQTGSMNITNNNNDTLLNYFREQTNIEEGFEYFSNFSDIKNFSDIHFIDFEGRITGGNSTTRGTYYFMPDYIVITTERDVFENFTGNERLIFNHYNVSDYISSNGTKIINPGGGDAFVGISESSYKFVTNMNINYSIVSRGQSTLVNKTGRNEVINSGLNLTSSFANGSTIVESSGSKLIQFRTSNRTEICMGTTCGTMTNVDINLYRKNLIFTMINFNESFFQPGDIFANSSAQIYLGLQGYTWDWATSCASGFSNTLHSCSPWLSFKGINKIFVLNKFYPNRVPLRLSELNMLHAIRLYHNESSLDRYFFTNYPFNSPTNEGLFDNTFNNTHTRAVGDFLQAVSLQDESQIRNYSIDKMLDYLYNSTIYNFNNGSTLITHSRNTKTWFDNYNVINTHTIGVSAMITAKNYGSQINDSFLNNTINTMILFENYMFNETNGNDSYYAIGSNNSYFGNKSYGRLNYVDVTIYDYRIAYTYKKNETLRTIANRKIDELNTAWNGTTYTSPYNLSSDWVPGTNEYARSKARYMQLNITAFDLTGNIDKNFPAFGTNPYGFREIPNNIIFTNTYYPIFLTNDNRSFFIDNEDNLRFSTPAYAMIPDFKYDSSLQGMRIWVKWAYNTSGNFTNISTPPYTYIYDSQQQKFINYSEQLSWTATENTINYWMGNISDSISFTPNGTNDLNILSDGEVLGKYTDNLFTNLEKTSINLINNQLSNALLYNTNGSIYGSSNINDNDGNINITLPPNNASYVLDNFNLTEGIIRENSPLSFVSSSTTEKKISSSLSDSITSTVVVNVAQCSFNAEFQEEGIQEDSCENNIAVFTLTEIPSGQSTLGLSYVDINCDANTSASIIIILILTGLSIAIVPLLIYVKWQKDGEVSMETLLVSFIIIIVGLVLFVQIAQNLGSVC